MDNLGIARIFTDIGDLLEIKGANPFKIRAYRNAADIVGHMAERIADLTDEEVREIPGIGKDLTAKIRELIDTAALAYYDERDQIVKRMTYDQIETMDGRRIPTRWTMVDADNPESRTVITIESIEFDLSIDEEVFSLRRLRNPQ